MTFLYPQCQSWCLAHKLSAIQPDQETIVNSHFEYQVIDSIFNFNSKSCINISLEEDNHYDNYLLAVVKHAHKPGHSST